jgi:hypothetical protein
MSVARIVALAISAETTSVALWTALECAIGLIVACCPALRVLFPRPGEQSSLAHSSDNMNTRRLTIDTHRPASRRLSKRLQEHWRHNKEGLPLVAVPDDRTIYKAVEFEIASDVASEGSRIARHGTVRNSRIESWVEV